MLGYNRAMGTKTRVGVLRGGPSSEYDVSLQTGAAVLEHLPNDRYEPLDIFIDKQGVWHHRGRPMTPERALSQLDCAFIAMHGTYGEDGMVQKILRTHGTPFTGSDAVASSIAMNKALAKERLKPHGIKMGYSKVVHRDDITSAFIHEVFRTFPHPCVIKPLSSGSSHGVAIARTYHELFDALVIAADLTERIMLEEYIAGTEVTCGIIEDFRGERLYTLPEIEIVPHATSAFFDHAAKYEGKSDEICPGRFTREIKDEIAHLARMVHSALDLRHYSRSDFIIGKRGIHFLEVNTLPCLTPASLLPKAVEAVGCSFSEFLDHLVQLSLKRA